MASMIHEASTMSMQNKVLWSKMDSQVLSLGPVGPVKDNIVSKFCVSCNDIVEYGIILLSLAKKNIAHFSCVFLQ